MIYTYASSRHILDLILAITLSADIAVWTAHLDESIKHWYSRDYGNAFKLNVCFHRISTDICITTTLTSKSSEELYCSSHWLYSICSERNATLYMAHSDEGLDQVKLVLACQWSSGYIHDDVIKWKPFSALLALCEGNSPATGELPPQRPVTRNFDVLVDLCLNKRSSKPSRRRWLETPSRSLWRHCNDRTCWQEVENKSQAVHEVHVKFALAIYEPMNTKPTMIKYIYLNHELPPN